MSLHTWLTARKKTHVFELLRDHSNKALQVVDEFLVALKAAFEGDQEAREAAFNRGTVREREGDAYRRGLMEELAKGELLPEQRDYLMRLARRIDAVADYAHGANRILSFLPIKSFDPELRQEVGVMCSKVRDCVASLDCCVRSLTDGDLTGATKCADSVEELEEEVDELHMKTRKILMKDYYAKADPRTIMFASEFLEAVEETSDRCEDVSDQVKILLVYMSQPSS